MRVTTLSILALALCLLFPGAVNAERAPLVGPGERLLVVAPHPDDETLGAAGLIQRVLAQGGTVRIVLVTAGDGYVEAVVHDTGQLRPRPSEYVRYGQRRLAEARAATRVLGDDRIRLQFLGFPDGGLQGLLRAHWWRSSPERSSTTEASDPPHDEALEPDVPYDGDDLRRELLAVLRETRPTIVVLPDPLDRHPDHSATALFTLLALDDWLHSRAKPTEPMPRLFAYLVHWPDWPPGWNAKTPSPVESKQPLMLPRSLPSRRLERVSLTLTDDELASKRAALAKYTSQMEVMGNILVALTRRTEPFTVLSPAGLRQIGHMIQAPEPTPQHR